jgi:hypothetical protein
VDVFLPNPVKLVLLGLIAIAIVLGAFARRFPEVRWLQSFRLPERPMSEEQRARRRRAGNRRAGVEMILAGFVIPTVYLLSNVMFLSEPRRPAVLVVGAIALLCVVLGIVVLVRNR